MNQQVLRVNNQSEIRPSCRDTKFCVSTGFAATTHGLAANVMFQTDRACPVPTTMIDKKRDSHKDKLLKREISPVSYKKRGSNKEPPTRRINMKKLHF
jgi:hypothetical protein